MPPIKKGNHRFTINAVQLDGGPALFVECCCGWFSATVNDYVGIPGVVAMVRGHMPDDASSDLFVNGWVNR